jgi:hypothetical protein
MSETRSSNNFKNPKENDLVRIANFMNGFLNIEMFEEIEYPVGFQRPFDSMSPKAKMIWYEYTYHEIFRDASMCVTGFVGRSLSRVELNLIQRRVLNFFKQMRIEQKN